MKSFHEEHNKLLREALSDVEKIEKQYKDERVGRGGQGEFEVRQRWIKYRKDAKELRKMYEESND